MRDILVWLLFVLLSAVILEEARGGLARADAVAPIAVSESHGRNG